MSAAATGNHSPEPPANAPDSASALLRLPGFRALMLYRICTILSYQVVAVTVGWQVYELTRNPFSLGLIGLAEVLPFFCVAPFAGHLVDSLPRRKLGMAACATLALTALLLAGLTLAWPMQRGVWPIYLMISLGGMARAFLGPVYNALFARVLKREQFAHGASLGSVVFQTGLVLGPALGGALIAWGGGIVVAYAVAAGFGALAVLALARMPVTEPPIPQQPGPILDSIAQGFRFVFGHQVLLGAIALDMFAVLLGGAISLAPAFIREILDAGPEALGILRAAPAAGSVMAAVWLSRRPLTANAGPVLLASVACFGLCMIGFGLSTAFWLSAGLLLVSGVFDGISAVLRTTIMQLATPDDMRGRVSSINSVFISSSNELGAFYAGSMARLLGLVPAVVFGGCMTLVVTATTARMAPKLRRLDLRDL